MEPPSSGAAASEAEAKPDVWFLVMTVCADPAQGNPIRTAAAAAISRVFAVNRCSNMVRPPVIAGL